MRFLAIVEIKVTHFSKKSSNGFMKLIDRTLAQEVVLAFHDMETDQNEC